MNNIGYILRQPASGMPPVWKASVEEPYYIRRFDPDLPRDLETVYLMDLHPSVQDMPEERDEEGNELTYEEMLSYEDNLDEKRTPSSIFAITDDESRVIGWVWYYADKHNSFPDVLAKELSFDGSQTLFLEISYQKLGSDWPDEVLREIKTVEEEFLRKPRKGVAVSGVRQTLKYLRESSRFPKIIVYAYTDLDNYASEKVLGKNGFRCAKEMEDYDGELNHVWFREI